MIFYIGKLKEEFDFPYIPNVDFYPPTFYKNIVFHKNEPYWNKFMIWHFGTIFLDHLKSKDLLDLFISKLGKENIFSLLSRASSVGNLYSVKHLFDKYSDDISGKELQMPVISAAKHGHLNVVKYLISEGADNYEEILSVAEEEQNLEMINYINQILKYKK